LAWHPEADVRQNCDSKLIQTAAGTGDFAGHEIRAGPHPSANVQAVPYAGNWRDQEAQGCPTDL